MRDVAVVNLGVDGNCFTIAGIEGVGKDVLRILWVSGGGEGYRGVSWVCDVGEDDFVGVPVVGCDFVIVVVV